MLGDINDGGSFLVLSSVGSSLLIDKWPQLVGVDDWSPLPVSLQMEYSDTALSEVTLMTD